MTPGTLMTPTRSLVNFMSMDPFRLLQNRSIRLFEDPFTAFRSFPPTEENLPFTTWTPPCDIFETDKELVLKMELPEMKKEDVHVTVENNVLTLRGERKFEEKVNGENYHRVERNYGEFLRSFTLPAFVEGSKIFAEFKDGLLTVTLPKNTTAVPRQIEVKVK
ncbi:MAG TPA: Hsp20/alpha crystallin family protein [Pyrinomonadaceae bacterium]